MGCGPESNAGQADTPGFVEREKSILTRDNRGFTKLEMKRDSKRMHQSSQIALQAWRANCDVQVLIYSSDPRHPDPADIARVTDYVVAYACKGNQTIQAERTTLRNIIKEYAAQLVLVIQLIDIPTKLRTGSTCTCQLIVCMMQWSPLL